MNFNDVFVSSQIVALIRVERLKQFELYKIKKKNAPISRRSVLGGLSMLCTQDRLSASIRAYRNIYNIFVGHMHKNITFVTSNHKTSSQRFAKVGRGI